MNTKLKKIFFFAALLLTTLPGYAHQWKRVFLATYPRSGNHWVRYLLEEATHIATGSVYCDPDPQHLPDLFPWGAYCTDHGYEGTCRFPEKDDIVVIKTHFPFARTKFDSLKAIKTIRIVRHPVDSIYSFYVYKHHGHPPQEIIPSKSVKNLITTWNKFQTHWDNQKNVLTIRYEDLYKNPLQTFTKIIEAIGYEVSPADIERAVNKYPPEGKLLRHLDKYRHEDLVLISKSLRHHMRQFKYKIPGVD